MPGRAVIAHFAGLLPRQQRLRYHGLSMVHPPLKTQKQEYISRILTMETITMEMDFGFCVLTDF